MNENTNFNAFASKADLRREKAEAKKATAAQAARDLKLAEYKKAVEALRSLRVIESARDTMYSGLEIDERAGHMLYIALDAVATARAAYETKLRWLVDACAEATRDLNRGSRYSSEPVQGRGAEVDAAHAAYIATGEAARNVCRFAKVHCPALCSVDFNERRALLLRIRVAARMGGFSTAPAWIVREIDEDGNAKVPDAIAKCENEDGAFETEYAAWRAVSYIVGDIAGGSL